MRELETQEAELDLSYYLDIFLRRRWIVLSVWVMVLLSTALYTFTRSPIYQAGALLVIEKERGGGTVYSNGAMIESSNDDYYQTQYKLLKSDSLLQKVYEDLHLEDMEEFSQPNGLKKLQESVTVSPVLRSRLVYVKVDSHNPQLAARISNSISQSFVEQNLSNQLFISKEILQALQFKRSEPGSRRLYESLPAVVNNTLIQNLKAEYAKLEAQFADMSKRYTERYPAVIALKSNMAALKGQIEVETEKIVQSLKTELSGQLKGNNVRIIDPARVPGHPIKPRKKVALLLGLLVGLVTGFALALVVEMLDQSVRTQEDVEDKLHLPFLGLIPHSELNPSSRVYHSLLSQEPSLTSEAMRNLRTMVDFAGVSQKTDALLVTSSLQEEGKTYVASNLAVVFAQLGEKVLLIDGDLRRPKLHKNFHLSSSRGLSDYLAGGNSVEELEEALQKTEIQNLKVLTCGPRPPNPSELLNTPRVSALIAWAQAQFDRIIIDCAPIFPISDTLLWGRHVRSTVFVVRYGKTRVPLIKNACQRLQTSGLKILGAVINGAKHRGLAYSSYGYYYKQYYHDYQEAETSKV